MNIHSPKIPLFAYFAGVTAGAGVVFAGLLLVTRLLKDGLIPVASLAAALIVFVSLVVLKRTFSPYRWMLVSLVFVVLFSVYPFVSTLIISTTNMSGGHLFTKQQAIERLEAKTYIPPKAKSYQWTAYTREGPSWRVLFQGDQGRFFLGRPGKSLEDLGDSLEELGPLEKDGKPLVLEGHQRVPREKIITIIDTLGGLVFYDGKQQIKIKSLTKAEEETAQYAYQAEDQVMVDLKTGTEYREEQGTFTSSQGEELIPGFKVNVGLDNYKRFIRNPGYRQPLIRIFLWNVAFALFSVVFSFALGLTIALVFKNLPGRRIIRTLLIIPYPIPVLLSIIVWKGLLNSSVGLIPQIIESAGLVSPPFFTHRLWTRLALVVINLYLSYPYFYILATGAVRSIPGDIFEAAEIDGASNFQKMSRITLPLVLKILMPLIIASFCFNFNNFTLIWVFNAGQPAMADAIVPMGHTDLLVSFIYRLGFSTANAANYGFAAAITVLLFLIIALLMVIQVKSSRALKED